MQKLRYALVAYLKKFRGRVRREPPARTASRLPHFAAHLTILPPRPLRGTEGSALEILERICGEQEPFQVTLGAVETFVPVTPTFSSGSTPLPRR